MSPQPKCRAVSTETPGRFEFECGWTADGIDFHGYGCRHATPREAVDHVETTPIPRAPEPDTAWELPS